MPILTLRELPNDERLRESWNALVLQTDSPQVFYTFEWAIAVQRAYAATFEPLILLFYDPAENRETLIGVAALATSGKRAFFLTANTADYCDFVSRPERREEIVGATLQELRARSIQSLVLANLPADSPTSALLARTAPRHGFHVHVRDAYVCARLLLQSAEQRMQLKEDVNRKKVYRRAVREMSKHGLEILHRRQWSELEAGLPAFYRAHIVRFRETGRISNIESPQRRTFLDELAKELAKSEWVVLSCLRLADTTIAWNYGFRFHGSWFWYQPTFDSKYEQLSPGLCLLGKIIEEACDSPDVEVVDLGLGAEGYKERFATSGRRTLYATLNRSLLAHCRTALRFRVATLVRRSPRLEVVIRSMIRVVSGPRARRED